MSLNLPAHLANRDARGVAAALAATLSGGSPPYLSIKGNQFTLFDAAGNSRMVGAMDPQAGLYVDVVVADANPHKSRVYYADAFDPSATDFKPPTCFSDNGEAPSYQSQKPQAPTCAACPHSVWGSEVSKLTGKGIPACNEAQKLAILIPGDPQNMVFLLRVPPASLKHLGKYVREIGAFSAGGRKVDVSDLVTRISFEKGVNGILHFQPIDFINEQTMQAVDNAVKSNATRQITGADDKPFTGQITEPAEAPRERQLAPPPAAPVQQTPERFAQQANMQASAEPPVKPRGRPRKAAEAPAPAPASQPVQQPPAGVQVHQSGNVSYQAPAQQDELEIPPFLRRDAQQPAAPQNFGIQKAEPAPDDMAARLKGIFSLPTS